MPELGAAAAGEIAATAGPSEDGASRVRTGDLLLAKPRRGGAPRPLKGRNLMR
jgi:hypothetical protein